MLVVFGFILGSFVNAFVWRIHQKKNWVSDRSECTHCHHKLAPLDLIPVISWLLLHGKCRYCHKKIEDTPLAELAMPMLFVVSYAWWPMQLEGKGLIAFIFWLVFLIGFLALTIYDFRWFLLPDKIVFPLVGLALAQVIAISVYSADWRYAANALGGALVVSGIFYLLYQISKGTWIGGGDVKLGLVLGLLAGGVLEGFLVLFAASAAGLAATLPQVVRGKAGRKTQIPFGPFLILGLIVVTLFGADILDWYAGVVYG